MFDRRSQASPPTPAQRLQADYFYPQGAARCGIGFAEGGVPDGSLHCTLVQAAVYIPVGFTKLEGRSGDGSRLFAAFLARLPDTAPSTVDPA